MSYVKAPAGAPASPQPGVAARRRSPVESVIDRIWRFFCSVRAGIYEIAFLALLVLIGTLRGSSVPRMLADAVPLTAPLVDRWYAWDVFRSALFAGTLALISVAIAIGGMVNRAPGIWRTITNPTVMTTWGFLRGARPSAAVVSPTPAEALTDTLVGALRGRGYRVLTASRDGEVHLYADKNRWAKLGTFPFHIALILILVGGIVGARFGFRDTEFVVAEGQTLPVGHGTDLSLRLDRFTDDYYEDGNPRDYASQVTVLDGGVVVDAGPVRVNHPLTYRDVTVYQASFGDAVTLRVSDPGGRVLREEPVSLGIYRARSNDDAPAGFLAIPEAGVTLNLIAPDENAANAPELDTLRLRPSQLYVEARSANLEPGVAPPSAVVDVNGAAQVGPVRVEFLRHTRFATFQVARNPGVPIFIVASVLLVGGLLATFYFPHRRVRAIIAGAQDDGGSRAELAPLARRDWSGQRDFHRLLDDLRDRIGLPITVRGDDDLAAPTGNAGGASALGQQGRRAD